MKILVVGAGGIGGFYGAQLHQVGADITFLLRGKRKQLIDEKGLTIETPENHFTIFPKTVLADQLEPIYDLIILAVSSQAIRSVGHWIRDRINIMTQELNIVCAAKGICVENLELPIDTLRNILPSYVRLACLSGPTFAAELMQNLPAATELS